MSVLAGLKPERVFYYFEELCRIPHGSGNTKEVSDYLVQFARNHELSWYQDASNNVIIRRPASKGCELAPTVILQGHCDMVCEKKPGSSHDFTKDGLELHIDGGEKEILKEEASRFTENLRREYSGTDDGITVTVEKTGEGAAPALHPVSLQKTVFFLMNLPNGVQKMSGQIPGLVETSLNLGILKLEPDHLHACASVRSSVGSAKEALSDKLEYLIGFLGGEFYVEGAYPAWEYKEDSALRDLMVAEYEAMYGQKPAVEAIHAGLECGLFYEKLSGLDCVSFGPNMKAIHTTEERLSISSVERTYQYLCRVLEQLSKRQA